MMEMNSRAILDGYNQPTYESTTEVTEMESSRQDNLFSKRIGLAMEIRQLLAIRAGIIPLPATNERDIQLEKTDTQLAVLLQMQSDLIADKAESA